MSNWGSGLVLASITVAMGVAIAAEKPVPAKPNLAPAAKTSQAETQVSGSTQEVLKQTDPAKNPLKKKTPKVRQGDYSRYQFLNQTRDGRTPSPADPAQELPEKAGKP